MSVAKLLLVGFIAAAIHGAASGEEPAATIPERSTFAPTPPTPRGPVQRCLNKVGLGCWSHHTQMGCGSFHSEMRFIFGSCRAFYGDRCIPNPPHSDRDPYWRNPCGAGKCGP